MARLIFGGGVSVPGAAGIPPGVRALTVLPGKPGTLALTQVDEPPETDGEVLVDVLSVGICGTDREIVAGEYGQAPPGRQRLVLGHESLGRVRDAPVGCGLEAGDLVVAMVRCPDPVPCANCAAGQWDMCRNGRYTEHGVKGLDGFARERYRAAPDRLIRLDAELRVTGVLLEPASIVAKAWALCDLIAGRAAYRPRTAVITGAGPVGLLAALFGVRRGLEVHVIDLVGHGRKPQLVRELGAQFHSLAVDDLDLVPDLVIECTGVPSVVFAVLGHVATDGVICLTGTSVPGRRRTVDLSGLNRKLVLQNSVVLGSMNARREHYQAAADALAAADPGWLARMITRRLPLTCYHEAFERQYDDVKVVLDLTAESEGEHEPGADRR